MQRVSAVPLYHGDVSMSTIQTRGRVLMGRPYRTFGILFGEVPRPAAWAGMLRAFGPWGGDAAGPSVEMVQAESSR